MKFTRSVQRYGTSPEPVTPYQRAGQLWDERIGSARVQARNWRLMAIGELALVAGLASGLIWQSMQSRILPYVVEVDRLGAARAVSPADVAYRPSDPQIAWFLSSFIADIRSVSLDPVLMRASWLRAYDFVTDRGALALNAHATSTNPFGAIGDTTVSVQITSVVRVSDRSFQVKWTESKFERGALAETARWTAILTMLLRPPKSAETLRKNPLGLYVDAVDWSREYEPGPSAAPHPRAPGQSAGTPPRSKPAVPAVSPDFPPPPLPEIAR